jgi:TRAP-type C4-dicarboxylate transport system permease small subunit
VNSVKVIGTVLVLLGLLGLAYGGFSYTRQTSQVQLGPLELSVNEQETVNIPVWAGGAAVALGVVLLVVGGRR